MHFDHINIEQGSWLVLAWEWAKQYVIEEFDNSYDADAAVLRYRASQAGGDRSGWYPIASLRKRDMMKYILEGPGKAKRIARGERLDV